VQFSDQCVSVAGGGVGERHERIFVALWLLAVGEQSLQRHRRYVSPIIHGRSCVSI
jgi:hypothetical protein